MNLQHMRAVALAATPGPWVELHGRGKELPRTVIRSAADKYVCVIESGSSDADREHIATFSPSTVLKMLNVIEQAKRYAPELADWEHTDLGAALKTIGL